MVIDPMIGKMSLGQAPGVGMGGVAGGVRGLPSNPFDDVLARAVDALEWTSQAEFTANYLINKYIEGKAELSDVMVATSKMNIAVQLAVTVITNSVSTFKEITQMQM